MISFRGAFTNHRDRNKKADLLARTYDHVTGKYCKGFIILALGGTDGFSFIPVLFNLLSSAKRENRWSIECFFKASKSCLKLGREYQNRKYEVSVAHTAIVFTRYIILEWIRRKDNDDRTHGELFRMMCDEVSDMSIMEALASLLLLLLNGAKQFGKEYTESIKCKVTYCIGTIHRFYGLLETVFSWES